ncbi:MAG: PKD domain-containing protein [Myxococcaceae bacterium]
MRALWFIAAAAFVAGCQCGSPANTGNGDNAPPTAAILSPNDGALLTGKGPYTFVGSGSDAEDGTLAGASLSWRSDLDGPLGTGGNLSTPLRSGTHRITLEAKDSKGALGQAQISVTVSSENSLPVAAIDSPANGIYVDQGSAVQLTGHATDAEDGALAGGALSWSSDKQGALGTGGAVSFTATQVGAQQIVLTAVDSSGGTAYATITLNVVLPGGNKPPAATISQPSNNAQVTLGANVSFAGSATDPEDGALTGASLSWTSSKDGALGTGGSFSKTNLTQGAHVVTLTATDSKGLTGAATVNFTVNAPNNQPPTVSITAPANNFTAFFGTNITFTGAATDPEDGALTGASLAWTSSKDGAIGTGASMSSSTLSTGSHTIRLTATDSGGNSAVASIAISILPQNQPPVVSITSPTNNQSFTAGTVVQLRGTANDPEDGALTGNSLTWRSDRDGVLGNGASLDTSSLSVGVHQLTLTALDSGGRSGSASVTITITSAPVKLPPVARLTGPTQGQVGVSLGYSGSTSSDPDGTVVSYRFNFGDGSAPVTGASSSASHTFAAAGLYTVTLTVTDNDSLTGTASLQVDIPTTARIPSVVDTRGDQLGSMCQLGAQNGVVQVAYRDDTHPAILYGELNGSAWTTEIVDGMGFNTGGLADGTFAMVVESNGTPHVAYRLDSNQIWYAKKVSGAWIRERVDGSLPPYNNSGYRQLTIALDPANGNRPTILYTGLSATNYPHIDAAVRMGSNSWTNTQLAWQGGASSYQYLAGEAIYTPTGTLLTPIYLSGFNAALGAWDGTANPPTVVDLGTSAGAGWSAWTPLAWRGTNQLLAISSTGVFDISVANPISGSTANLSLVENFNTSLNGIAADSAGLPRVVVNHGTELEVVQETTSGYWTRQSLGQTDSAGIDVAVDGAGRTRACFFRNGKLLLY